jgi:hypothetical protein
METFKIFLHRALLLAPFVFSVNAVFAGRPLTVDDAGTDLAKAGHMEIWLDRQGDANTLNIAPAYTPMAGLEFSVPYARISAGSAKQIGFGIKWIPSPDKQGFRMGLTATVLRNTFSDADTERVLVLNCILTREFSNESAISGALHFNLGVTQTKPAMASAISNTTWGIAYEQPIGNYSAHIESFGATGSKPTTQVGLAKLIIKNVQLDGTVGRSTVNGAIRNIASIGIKVDY